MAGPLMPPRRKWGVWLVAGAIWTTGLIWLGLHYFAPAQGQFGPEANPAEPWILRAHAAAAFASIWTLGLLWAVHVTPGWGRKRKRWSGGLVFGVGVLLVASGYLLYYVGDEGLRSGVSLLHWGVGLAALPFFLMHTWRRTALRRATKMSEVAETSAVHGAN
jgi:hypothetical protein